MGSAPGWPNSETDWDTLLWCILSPDAGAMRPLACEEIGKRLDPGVDLQAELSSLLAERVELDTPVGADPTWVPRRFRRRHPRPTTIVEEAELTTASGSLYRVSRGVGESWWLCSSNVPSADSVRLNPADWWEIERPHPWPPRLGESLTLHASLRLEPGDERRCPGGGKVTSSVRMIHWLTIPQD